MNDSVPPKTILDDDTPEAPPLHATASPGGDPSNPPAYRAPADHRAIIAPLGDPEHAEKVKAAFEFVPVWQRYNRETAQWEDYALEAFSLYRRQLWWRLLANMVPLPAQGYGRYSTATAFDGWAAIYLCSHQPAQFAHLISNPPLFVQVITEWAGQEIPEEMWTEATNLAWRMDECAELTAVRLPKRPSLHTPGK